VLIAPFKPRLSRHRGKSVSPQPVLVVVQTVRGLFKTGQPAGRYLAG
jgi:hypothetical protein